MAGNKPVIAVDIDEVLFPMSPTFLRYYNTTEKTDYTLDQMISYYFEAITGDSREEILSKIKAYLKTEDYEQGKPVAGSIDAIRKLRKRFRLIVVTSRANFFRGHTEDFLEKHFAGLYDDLYYTHSPDKPDVLIPKEVICKEVDAVALIDDHLSNVIACAKEGIDGVLFGEYAWNQADKLPKGVT